VLQLAACGAGDGDLLLISAGKLDPVCKTLDRVRQFVAEQLGEIPAGKHNLLWVTDFPMFGWNEEEQRLEVRASARAFIRLCLTAAPNAGDAPPVHCAQRGRHARRRHEVGARQRV
jgi:aspartyl-tRNA synthetase